MDNCFLDLSCVKKYMNKNMLNSYVCLLFLYLLGFALYSSVLSDTKFSNF